MAEHVPLHLRVADRFTLQAASQVARATSEAARARLREGNDRARDLARAADALFCDGLRAEALRLMGEALDATLALVDDAAHERLLAHRGIALGPARALADDLRRSRDDARAPAYADARYFRALATRRRLDEALALAASTERQLQRSSRARVALSILGLVVAVVVTVVPFPQLPRMHVTASGQWAFDAHFPRDAVDGDEETEWQTPNHQPGWLEVRVDPPVDVTRVRLLNGHNGRFGDRGCARALVSLYRRGELQRTLEFHWPTIQTAPVWQELPVQAMGIDKIRVDVVSHHGVGAALAEIAWE
ncbi:MAG: hypothetical protein H6719_35305 [Sandaracinaceae bacterium]|nr:hypothetical protein [Sandaracinaceae bacterium]